MLIKRPKIRIISKEIALATGELALAFFAVIENNGAFEIKFLGTKPIAVTLLENKIIQIFGETIIKKFEEKLVYFFSLDLLINQLARAPSFN